jgi:hypothetical protein
MKIGGRMVGRLLLGAMDADARTAKLAISIARKMNALIFLVPEDIVDVRPRLVCFQPWLVWCRVNANAFGIDFDVYWELVGHCELVCDASKI